MDEDFNKLWQQREAIRTREDLINFITDLKNDFENNPDHWEAKFTYDYLSGVAGYVHDGAMIGGEEDRKVPEQDVWNMFAEILHAAQVYE